MSQTLLSSATDYCQAQKIQKLSNSIRQTLPISSYKLPTGKHQIISHYHEDIWQLEDARFPSNIIDAYKLIYFNTIPKQFIEAVKFALKNYDIKENPRGNTLINFFHDLKPFLIYLDKLNVKSTIDINPLLCANYVAEAKQGISTHHGKPLSRNTLFNRFKSVVMLYQNLKGTDWELGHPWIESSAYHLAGATGLTRKKISSTKVIDVDELKVLIQYCNKTLERAHILIELQNDIMAKRQDLLECNFPENFIKTNINEKILQPKGYVGLKEFNVQYHEIQSAIAIIILNFSGIRSHELCAIQSDAYRVERNDEDVYYWLQSHSSKTNEGYTEWLVPEIVIKAIEIQKTYIKSLQKELWCEQKKLFNHDLNNPRALKIDNYKDHLFLTKSKINECKVNALSGNALLSSLKKIGDKLGIYHLAPHRFRRTFAVYVAQSMYGDLRYLKQHFKHWSMDMTLLYSFNDFQSVELYDEIAIEIKNYKIARVEEFLDEDAIITGGLANNIISYRSSNESIRTFNSRTEMAEKVSDTIYIRSTGHSWCTADNAGCGGRSVIESTACIDCGDSIIEKKRHGDFFKGIYIQQLELREVDDIGEAGKQRVERDIERCERVLKDLGMWEEVKRLHNV